jgi:HK97 family phage portal protein
MGLVRTLAQSGPGPNPRTTTWLRYPFFSARTESGEEVTVEDALTLDVVWSAIRLRSWGVGQLPLLNYRRNGDEFDREPRTPTARVLLKPNREHTSINCWGLVSTHLNSWGNAYVGKTFELLRPDVVKELWPWHPKFVRPARENGVKLFYLTDPETLIEDPTPYTAKDFIHVLGFSIDGLQGLSPIGVARESLGGMRARQRKANRDWRENNVPAGIVTTDSELDRGVRRRLERDWNRKYRGLRGRRTAFLEKGLKFQAVSLPPADAQFIESEQFAVQQAARWFNLSAGMLNGSSGDPMLYKNLEGLLLRHLIVDLQPELVTIEQAIAADPDLYPQRPGDFEPELFPEFKTGAYLRADTRGRFEAFAIANGGRAIMRPSEQRRELNLPADPELDDWTLNPIAGVAAKPRAPESSAE